MCKHCENLVEDKEVVHRFFEVGAQRLNEMLPKRTGMPLHRPVTADDIEAPTLTVHAMFWRENTWPTLDGYRILDEMDDYSSSRRRQEEPLSDPENRKRFEAMLSEMANLEHYEANKTSRLATNQAWKDRSPEQISAYNRAYYQSHKVEHQARTAVRRALKAGLLTKPSKCQRCPAETDKLIGHHHSYEPQYWLDVEWLCKKCHVRHHAEENNAAKGRSDGR